MSTSNQPDDHSRYYQAVSEADDDLADALTRVRAEEDAHRLSPAQAGAERCQLLERHLERLAQLRAEHLADAGQE